MSYEISGTNGNYGGLSSYHGLGNGGRRGRDRERGERPRWGARGRGRSGQESTVSPTPATLSTPPPEEKANILEMRSVQAGRSAEQTEQQAGQALATGQDNAAQQLMARATDLQERSIFDQDRSRQLRLPYANVPMVPKAIEAQANVALTDTPLKIADQTAPTMAPVPTTAAATTPATVPATIPMLPSPLLLAPPGYRVGYPMMGPPRMAAPMGPAGPMPMGPRPMMGPPRTPGWTGGMTPNVTTAAAALAAAYFLFL